nr:hypothetical protein CFP56_43600 [Quercus suber]
MHYDGQLRASHPILGCVASYTSYQDSSRALTAESPLLSYLDVRLPRFLPKGLTSGEARELGPRLVKHGSLEPIQDSSRDTIFQGRAVHTLVEVPILGSSDKEGLVTEETNSRKHQKGANSAMVGDSTLSAADLPPLALGQTTTQPTDKTPHETQPPSQPVIIDSQVVASSSSFATRDAENSAGPVIFQARKFRFMEGWLATVNALGLPDDSLFRSTKQVTLPEDSAVET